MADEQPSIAESAELATPAPPTEAETTEDRDLPQDVGTDSEAATGTEEGEDGQATDEFEEFEHDGVKYQVPKALKPHLLRDADYTQKNQKVAETARALEAQQAEIEERSKATDEELNERATLQGVKAQLADFAKVDWDAYEQQDPLAAQRHWRQFQQLQGYAQEAEGRLTAKAAERSEKAQQDTAKRVQETVDYAKKNIPGWKPELDNAVVKFALDEGVPQDFLRQNMSPTLYKLLHRAMLGTDSLKKQVTAKPAPVPVAPLKVVGGRASPAASKSLSDLANGGDMEAYAAARKAGRVR